MICSKSIGTKANLLIAATAGACTSVLTQPLDTASSRMQTSEFGKAKGLWKTLTEGDWGNAFDGLGISLLLTSVYSVLSAETQPSGKKKGKSQQRLFPCSPLPLWPSCWVQCLKVLLPSSHIQPSVQGDDPSSR